MEITIPVEWQTSTACRLCGTTAAPVTLTGHGWQCTDLMACLMRQPVPDAR